jgi:hypothetical protein
MRSYDSCHLLHPVPIGICFEDSNDPSMRSSLFNNIDIMTECPAIDLDPTAPTACILEECHGRV